MIANDMGDKVRYRPRRHDGYRESEAILIEKARCVRTQGDDWRNAIWLDGCWRSDVVIKASGFVVAENERGCLPCRSFA